MEPKERLQQTLLINGVQRGQGEPQHVPSVLDFTCGTETPAMGGTTPCPAQPFWGL